MKILMVSSYLPYPLYSGGQVRLYNQIKKLSSKHEITLVCEMRSSQTFEDIKEVEKYCKKVITVARKKQWSIGNIVKTAFSPNSFLYNGHVHEQMKEIINNELENNDYSLIHAETYYIMQNIPKKHGNKIPIVLVEHNIEYLVYARYIKTMPFWIAPLLMLDVHKIRKEEEKAWERADVLAAVSRSDMKVMYDAGFNPELVPNGVDVKKFNFDEKKRKDNPGEKRILFIGDFKWIQNKDSAKWIITEIWPKIRESVKKSSSSDTMKDTSGRQNSDLKLWIVGREIPDDVRKLADDPSVLFDEVSSGRKANELFQEAFLLLAPIRVGGGTSYKIIESMACGTPVVMTGLSADALSLKDELRECVGENEAELSDRTVNLISNKELYENISKKSRQLIHENFSWDTISSKLDKIYRNV